VELLRSSENLGFSKGHNRNLQDIDSDFFLLLNADVLLSPTFLEILKGAMSKDPKLGMAGGKLYRMGRDGAPNFREGHAILDSTGVYFTPSQRHLDRGSGELDVGQYDRPQLVFGITGAAMMCRRKMFEDLLVEGEFLDSDFFAYREDADLAWRAQLRGWKILYHPSAEGKHYRRVVPSNRRQLDPLINLHSLKNRYLLRAKNMDRAVRRKCFPYMWLRDLGILSYVLCCERTSLGAYRELKRILPRTKRKREIIQQNRTVHPDSIARWFEFQPVARDYRLQGVKP
jgi:GT2 family glycosyltransferase